MHHKQHDSPKTACTMLIVCSDQVVHRARFYSFLFQQFWTQSSKLTSEPHQSFNNNFMTIRRRVC
jgi:hypothetical protein